MLGINKEYDVALKAFDSQLFDELSDYEASVFTGGLSLTNETDNSIVFYIVKSNSNLKREVLKPGQTGSYDGENVLYDSLLGDPYDPELKKGLDNEGEYRFSLTGNRITIVGKNQNLLP